MSEAAHAAAAALLDDTVAAAAGATTQVVEQTAPEPTPEEVDLPDYSADTDGIEDLLNEPDFDDTELEDDHDDDPVLAESEYDDPDVAKLKAKLAKAEKQLRYQSELRAKDNLKGWRAEAARRFPLADVDEITGTSRRAVLRKASESHGRYEKKLAPILGQVDTLRAQVVQEAHAEGRAAAEAAYGRPTSGPTVGQVEIAERDANLDRKKYRTPLEMLRARMAAGQLDNF